jgi:hypothetical protein
MLVAGAPLPIQRFISPPLARGGAAITFGSNYQRRWHPLSMDRSRGQVVVPRPEGSSSMSGLACSLPVDAGGGTADQWQAANCAPDQSETAKVEAQSLFKWPRKELYHWQC